MDTLHTLPHCYEVRFRNPSNKSWMLSSVCYIYIYNIFVSLTFKTNASMRCRCLDTKLMGFKWLKIHPCRVGGSLKNFERFFPSRQPKCCSHLWFKKHLKNPLMCSIMWSKSFPVNPIIKIVLIVVADCYQYTLIDPIANSYMFWHLVSV